jgi:hypothetical protein
LTLSTDDDPETCDATSASSESDDSDVDYQPPSGPRPSHQLPKEEVRPHQSAPTQEEAEVNASPDFTELIRARNVIMKKYGQDDENSCCVYALISPSKKLAYIGKTMDWRVLIRWDDHITGSQDSSRYLKRYLDANFTKEDLRSYACFRQLARKLSLTASLYLESTLTVLIKGRNYEENKDDEVLNREIRKLPPLSKRKEFIAYAKAIIACSQKSIFDTEGGEVNEAKGGFRDPSDSQKRRERKKKEESAKRRKKIKLILCYMCPPERSGGLKTNVKCKICSKSVCWKHRSDEKKRTVMTRREKDESVLCKNCARSKVVKATKETDITDKIDEEQV